MIPLRDNIPSRKIPFVNYLLIGINILSFIYEQNLAGQGLIQNFIIDYGIVPKLLSFEPSLEWFRFLSAQFLHGGWMHLLGNMLYLYIFGDNVEDRFGHSFYIFFYLLCGIVSALGQIYFYPHSSMPMLGASGAIAGVLGAYFFFYPRARVLTLIPLCFFTRLIEVPAFFFLGFWFLMQALSGTSSLYTAKMAGHELGGVAWWAHASGFAFGLLSAFIKRIFF